MDSSKYFRKGLGNRERVAPLLHADYHSGLVEWFRASGFRYRWEDTEIRLAKEFGFCYGVDRAVEYAYECRDRFPDRRLWITGEIIHNPWVNRRLEEMGVRFLPPPGASADRLSEVAPNDVVIIPAFGMELEEFDRLREGGVVLVDTTCGSVLSVWKSVERYAREGFTAIVHGKVQHEETLATCSQVRKYPGAHYLVLRDREEAQWVCDFLEHRLGSAELLARLAGAFSDGFDPDRDLVRFGLANQTTMLSSESLGIARMLRDSVIRAHGRDALATRFRSFDTICSATQDRQDAVLALLGEAVDLMVVIGGFNSSNTTHLLEICQPRTRAYHVEDASCLISQQWIRHKPLDEPSPLVVENWLPAGPAIIGITAGASTPDREVGATIARVLAFRGAPRDEIDALAAHGSAIAAEKKAAQSDPLPVVEERN